MNTKKIIPALFLLTLSLTAKPSGNGVSEAVEKVKNKVVLPSNLFDNKTEDSVRLSFKVNASGQAEDVVINGQSEKVKEFVKENLSKINFNEKGEEINLILKFKLQ